MTVIIGPPHSLEVFSLFLRELKQKVSKCVKSHGKMTVGGESDDPYTTFYYEFNKP